MQLSVAYLGRWLPGKLPIGLLCALSFRCQLPEMAVAGRGGPSLSREPLQNVPGFNILQGKCEQGVTPCFLTERSSEEPTGTLAVHPAAGGAQDSLSSLARGGLLPPEHSEPG